MEVFYWTLTIASGICFGIYWGIDVYDGPRMRPVTTGAAFGFYLFGLSKILGVNQFILIHAYLFVILSAGPVIMVRRKLWFDRLLRGPFRPSATELRAVFRIDEAIAHDVARASNLITKYRTDSDFQPIRYLVRRIAFADTPALIARRKRLIAARIVERDPGVCARLETAIVKIDEALDLTQRLMRILGSPFALENWYDNPNGVEDTRVGLEMAAEVARDTLHVTQSLAPNVR